MVNDRLRRPFGPSLTTAGPSKAGSACGLPGGVVGVGWLGTNSQKLVCVCVCVRSAVFLTTVVAFFLVEMGDKTQIAAISLAARFHSVIPVAAGATLGMMAANIPAVFLGERAMKIVPIRYVRIGAALVFVALGVWTLVGAIRG